MAITRVRSTPPHCVAAFVARPAPNHAKGGEATQTLALACRCGSRLHAVLGHWFRESDPRDEPVLLGPLASRCVSCGRNDELIDTDVHGYNAESAPPSSTMRGEGKRSEFACPCGETGFAASAWYANDGETIALVREQASEGGEDFTGREQDLFTAFALFGKCGACGERAAIAAFECA